MKAVCVTLVFLPLSAAAIFKSLEGNLKLPAMNLAQVNVVLF
jgi:hypothetical protein